MKYDSLIFEKSGSLAVLRMNRPAALNAGDIGLFEDIIRALEACTVDDEIRVIIITGEGKAFCAGGDLAMFSTFPDPGEGIRQLTKRFHFIISGIRRIPKPVIAMINGTAAGGGFSIAAACDLRICAASAKFRQAYTTFGLVPDGAWTLFTPLLIGFSKAAELAYLDPIFGAAEALAMGFVNRVVEDADLERTTREIALQLAGGAAPAYAMVKKNFNEAQLFLLERMLELERGDIIQSGKTEDAKDRIAAFLEKTRPAAKGR